MTVSYCVFTYNQETYVEESVKSVINQTYSSLEIIISDDCSTDNTYSIIQRMVKDYKGKHNIIVNQNKKNLGIGAHFSNVIHDIASGDLIILLGGDDVAEKNHAEFAVSKMKEFKDVDLMDFSAKVIDTNGDLIKNIVLNYEYKKFNIRDYLNLIRIESFAPGRIIRKKFIQKFNRISINCPTEDSVLVLRSLITNGFMRYNKSLVNYRRHDGNFSSEGNLSNISYHAIISQYIKDVAHGYDSKQIDEITFQLLCKRIDVELKLRAVNVNYKKKSEILKALYIILIKIYYKFKIKLFGTY